MGNNTPKLDVNEEFTNIEYIEKREVIKHCKSLSLTVLLVSKKELQFIYLLYLNLKQRTILEGLDKEAFIHFC